MNDDDDEKGKTLVFANPLGDAPGPRPSPAYVSAEEHRLWRLRVEALEKGQEMLLNRVGRIENLVMNGQVETQRHYKALREENSGLKKLQQQTLELLSRLVESKR